MDLQKTKHEIKLAEWRGLVQECRSSGMTVRAWCAMRGITPQTYYRWQRQVWDAGVQQAGLGSGSACPITFAEYRPQVTAPSTPCPAVVLHLNCGRVEIHNGAARETIEATLSVLQHLC